MHRVNFRNDKIGPKRAFIESLWVLHLHRGLKTYNSLISDRLRDVDSISDW